MTKSEAIKAMVQGLAVTHRYFDEGEYLYISTGKIYSQDGVKHEYFWAGRIGIAWEKDWHIFPDKHGAACACDPCTRDRVEGYERIRRWVVPSLAPEIVGDSHRYDTSKGEISLIEPCFATQNLFEILCIKKNLFEGTERFKTLREAESRIKELLL